MGYPASAGCQVQTPTLITPVINPVCLSWLRPSSSVTTPNPSCPCSRLAGCPLPSYSQWKCAPAPTPPTHPCSRVEPVRTEPRALTHTCLPLLPKPAVGFKNSPLGQPKTPGPWLREENPTPKRSHRPSREQLSSKSWGRSKGLLACWG